MILPEDMWSSEFYKIVAIVQEDGARYNEAEGTSETLWVCNFEHIC